MPDEGPLPPLVFIELFGGILPASTAAEQLNLKLAAVYISELCCDALLVDRTKCPQVRELGDISKITESDLDNIITDWPLATFGIFGGPPCRGVSSLKSNRAGALGLDSGLHREFSRVANYFLAKAPGRTIAIMECTHMDSQDQVHYDQVFKCKPVLLCCKDWSPMSRPRAFQCTLASCRDDRTGTL